MAEKERNRITATLPPLYHRLVKANAEYTGQTESSVISDAVKEKFDKMPIQEREHILKMTEK
jgi:hypothetical protein